MVLNNTAGILRYNRKPIRQAHCSAQVYGKAATQGQHDRFHVPWMPVKVLYRCVNEAFEMLKTNIVLTAKKP